MILYLRLQEFIKGQNVAYIRPDVHVSACATTYHRLTTAQVEKYGSKLVGYLLQDPKVPSSNFDKN